MLEQPYWYVCYIRFSGNNPQDRCISARQGEHLSLKLKQSEERGYKGIYFSV